MFHMMRVFTSAWLPQLLVLGQFLANSTLWLWSFVFHMLTAVVSLRADRRFGVFYRVRQCCARRSHCHLYLRNRDFLVWTTVLVSIGPDQQPSSVRCFFPLDPLRQCFVLLECVRFALPHFFLAQPHWNMTLFL